MKIKRILASAGIFGNLRALIIVVAMAQLSFGQPITLNAPVSDFSISISPSSVVIPPGGTAKYTITVTVTNAASDLTFSVTGIPPDSTATISRESGLIYSLEITTSRLTRQGEYVFTVTATSGGMSASANATVIVLLAPS